LYYRLNVFLSYCWHCVIAKKIFPCFLTISLIIISEKRAKRLRACRAGIEKHDGLLLAGQYKGVVTFY